MNEVAAQIKKFIMGLELWEGLVLFCILIVVMLYFGSRASGWHRLAKHYPNPGGSHAEWISMPDFFDRPGRGGMIVDFNNGQTDAIKLGVDGQGVYLSMSFPFNIFHPPIFVPWSDVNSVAQGTPWSDKTAEIRFTFALSPNVPLDVDLQVADEIQKRADGRWIMPKVVSPKR